MKSIFRSIIFFISTLGVFVIITFGLSGLYFYNRLNRDLPKIEKLSDYKPKAVTKVVSQDGTLIAEVWDERRYPVDLEKIPLHVKNAFLAAEDSSFYEHSGIDFLSILRAVWVNFTSGKTKQGASTITQQIVKELLLSKEKTYERKLKEALLSYKLERSLSKDEILSIYLNQIFLGSGAYGVAAASRAHFRKDLNELSIAEAAFLGTLPKKPSELTRLENRQMVLDRQRYVLDQMYKKGFITKKEYQEAQAEKLIIYPQVDDTLHASPYFSSHAIREAEAIIQELNPELSIRDPGGYTVTTTLDINADKIAQQALRKGLMEVDKRQGWRGPVGNISKADKEPISWSELESEDQLKEGILYKALVTGVDKKRLKVGVRLGRVQSEVDLQSIIWAKTKAVMEPGSLEIKKFGINPIQEIAEGDIIEVSLKPVEVDKKRESYQLVLDQTPFAQAAFLAMSVQTGEVKSIIGGFDFKDSKFNRATQAFLQPGSSFKPFIYLQAVDVLGLNPSSIVPDSPISFPTPQGIWSPQNFDEKFLGPITLRVALQKSRNVVSVYLLNKIGVDRVINIAKKFGISTPLARNMSLSLGTSEIHLNEMVRAYAGFASSGYLPNQIIVKKISDREGGDIYTSEIKSESVVDPRSAFILQHMMRGVVDRGTAQNVKALGRPVAGKTGTTNDHMDAWFVGFTPDLVAGVWVGFDVKRSLGKLETGGKAAAPIFLDFMQKHLGDSPVTDFIPPEGVTPVAVDVNSGSKVDPDSDNAFIEYFRTDLIEKNTDAGFDPQASGLNDVQGSSEDYLRNSDF